MGELAFYLLCLGFLVLACIFYAIPTYIAFKRRHPNRWLIMVVNVAFGSSGVGWLASLIWALNAVHRPDTPGHSPGGESGLNLFVNDLQRIAMVGSTSAAQEPGENGPAWAIAQLERLNGLRAGGHLNEAEYHAMKAAVLQRL